MILLFWPGDVSVLIMKKCDLLSGRAVHWF